jgi:hypothetical protein
MKCPKCSHSAMSFGRSLVVFDPRCIHCKKCNAKLKLSHQWVSTFWVAIATAFVLGVLHALLDNLSSSGNAAVYIVIWIAVAMCYQRAFWRFATYEVMPTEGANS